MKKLFAIVMFLVAISITSFGNSKELLMTGKTYTAIGDYKIELAENPVVIDDQNFDTYLVSYQNSPMTVKVAVVPTKKCKNYLVISDKLCVKYVCNKKYFGVEKLDEYFKEHGYITIDESLNKNEYFHQRIISSGQNEDLQNVAYIAAYFHMLVKS